MYIVMFFLVYKKRPFWTKTLAQICPKTYPPSRKAVEVLWVRRIAPLVPLQATGSVLMVCQGFPILASTNKSFPGGCCSKIHIPASLHT